MDQEDKGRRSWLVVQIGAGVAAGSAGGLLLGLSQWLAWPAQPGLQLISLGLGEGALLGLLLGLCSLAFLPRTEGPCGLLGSWLRRGPAGPEGRSQALLISLLCLAQLLWTAGAWVDGAFHHRLLSAALLMALTLLLAPVGLALLFLVERLGKRWPWSTPSLLTLAALGTGLRLLATAPSPEGLHTPLLLGNGLLAGALAWSFAHKRVRLCRWALLAAPLLLVQAWLLVDAPLPHAEGRHALLPLAERLAGLLVRGLPWPVL